MLILLLLLIATCGTAPAQNSSAKSNVPKPGVKEVQTPFASLKPSATIKVGGTADWVLITDDAVWVEDPANIARLRAEFQTIWASATPL